MSPPSLIPFLTPIIGNYGKTQDTMKTLRAFALGLIEFRSDVTANCAGNEETYDWGREIAHRLTLRRYETA